MKIAIALEPGGVALAHFGRAGRFHVYDDREGAFHLLESRLNFPPCGCDDPNVRMAASAHLISDCAAVVAARFGPCALRETALAGVYPFEMEGALDDRLLNALVQLRDRLLPRRSKQEGRKLS